MLIGRNPEQLLISRLVAGARVGQSGVLVLSGEAGIGKTALIDWAAADANQMRVLRVSGAHAEAGVAFGALLQLLRPTLALLPSLPSPQRQALEIALALREGSVTDRFAIGAATLSLLSRYSEDHPVLVLVDDAHTVDCPSAEAIVFVARRLVADRIAMLLSVRPTDDGVVDQAGLDTRHVQGLDPDSAARLLATGSPTTVPREQVRRLHEACAGNPLALVTLSADPTAFERAFPSLPLPVPEAVTAAYRRSIESLSDAARAVLLVLAVANGDVPVAAAACTQLRLDLTVSAEAESAGLVRWESGQLRFRHPLVRSAVYAAAAPAMRRTVHRTVADAVPAADDERRAWHRAEATVGTDAAVAELLAAVAEEASRRGAYADAASAFERAALLTPVPSPLSGVLLGRAGESAWQAGQPQRATYLLDRALAADLDARLRTRLRGAQATVAARTGSLPAARTILSAAADEVAPLDPDGAVVLLADAVRVAFFMADSDGALAIARRLDLLVKRVTTSRAHVEGHLAIGISRVLAGSGGLDELRTAVTRLLDDPPPEADAGRAAWFVVGPLFLRESGTVRTLISSAVEARRTDGSLGALPLLLFLLARDDATTDRWASAEIGYREGIALATESGQTTDLAMCQAGLAWLLGRRGQTVECRTAADLASELCRDHGIHLGSVWAAHARVDLDLALGHSASAVQRGTSLRALLDGLGVHDVDLDPGPEVAESLMRTGDAAAARDVAEDYHRRAQLKRQPWALARAERALGIITTGDDAFDHFTQALELHGNTDDAFELARTELAYGARLRRSRRSADARPHLTSALRLFERLGSPPWADQCGVELAAAGGSVVRQGSGPRDVLTPQELQIAGMLGLEGRTTRQAAAALFLSPKTVEYHLRHIYTKLGVDARDALRRALETTVDRHGADDAPRE